MSMSCIPSAAYSTILARCTSRQVKVGVFARRSSSARSSCVSSIAQLDLRGIVAIIRQPPLVSFTNTLPDFRRRVLGTTGQRDTRTYGHARWGAGGHVVMGLSSSASIPNCTPSCQQLRRQ